LFGHGSWVVRGAATVVGACQLSSFFAFLYHLLQALASTPRRTLFELLCEGRMNVSNLEVPPPQQVQRISNEASDKDAEVRAFQLRAGCMIFEPLVVSLIATFEQASSR